MRFSAEGFSPSCTNKVEQVDPYTGEADEVGATERRRPITVFLLGVMGILMGLALLLLGLIGAPWGIVDGIVHLVLALGILAGHNWARSGYFFLGGLAIFARFYLYGMGVPSSPSPWSPTALSSSSSRRKAPPPISTPPPAT